MFHMKPNPQIEAYTQLLKEGNERLNLYSTQAYDKLPFHIQDCINIASFIGNKPVTVLDMGSGAGLPSVIIAIQNPKNTVYAVESKHKKHHFLVDVQNQLRLPNYHPICDDIHHILHQDTIHPHFITAKAFAPYPKLLKICALASLKNNPTLIVPFSRVQADDFYESTAISREHADTGHYYLVQSIRSMREKKP